MAALPTIKIRPSSSHRPEDEIIINEADYDARPSDGLPSWKERGFVVVPAPVDPAAEANAEHVALAELIDKHRLTTDTNRVDALARILSLSTSLGDRVRSQEAELESLRAAASSRSTGVGPGSESTLKKLPPVIVPPREDLESMTLPALKNVAKELGLEGVSSLNKADLVEAILAAAKS